MWYYRNISFKETPEDYQGFVYEITELRTGKKYIGKKNFWKPKTLPKNSKRKKRIRTRVESDWRSYFGSSGILNQLVEEQGDKSFKRVAFQLLGSFMGSGLNKCK